MITGDDYTAAYHAFDGDLPDEVPEHLAEWALALTWTNLPSRCTPGQDYWCAVSQTPAVDPDRGWPFRAWCKCGWNGPVRMLEVAAAVDLMNHAWPGWQDQPEELDPSPKGEHRPASKGHWLEALSNRSSRVVRVNVCGSGSSWGLPALCRGAVPYAGAGVRTPGVIVACVCPAHHDPAEAKLRGEAEVLWRAHWEERTAARWRARQAGIRPSDDPPDAGGQLALF